MLRTLPPRCFAGCFFVRAILGQDVFVAARMKALPVRIAGKEHPKARRFRRRKSLLSPGHRRQRKPETAVAKPPAAKEPAAKPEKVQTAKTEPVKAPAAKEPAAKPERFKLQDRTGEAASGEGTRSEAGEDSNCQG